MLRTQKNIRMAKMLNLPNAIVLLALAGFTSADYCQDNFTLAEMPEGILIEALSLLLTGTVDFEKCPEDVTVPDSDVNFWYYSRSNPTVPVLLDQSKPSQIDPNKPIMILAPGWLCNVTNDRMPQLRDAYLGRYDANVIGIDWTARSIGLYTEAFCSLPGVAQIVGKLLCLISDTLNVDLDQVHMVGHSLGGQMSGLVGQELKSQCNKILGRITALDPAGPLFQLLPTNRRLDKNDAKLVDVIHSNMGFLGFWGSCGKVDYYPNCGTFQPGCLKIDNSTNPLDIINLPLEIVGCNHLRSCDYMVESINSDKFVAKSCKTCPGLPIVGPCKADLLWGSTATMGEDSPPNPKHNQYTLTTKSKPPFAKG